VLVAPDPLRSVLGFPHARVQHRPPLLWCVVGLRWKPATRRRTMFGCGVCGSDGELAAWQGENLEAAVMHAEALILAFTFPAKRKTYRDGEQVGGKMGKEGPARKQLPSGSSSGLSSALSV
jgi:hypothetical protein